jgi:hypothetical protein
MASAATILHTLVLGSSSALLENTHISAGTVFWTYADWDFSAHLSEYYTPIKTVNLSYMLSHIWSVTTDRVWIGNWIY